MATAGPSLPSGHQAESASTALWASNVSSTSPRTKREWAKESAAPESRAHTSAETWSNRSRISSSDTRCAASSQTSEVGSTGVGVDFVPFWTKVSREISARLSSSPGTDYAALDSSSWSRSWKSLASNSWFATRAMRPPGLQTFRGPLCNCQPLRGKE